jgi:transcriptional regulator with XRE-family HTH domain
MIYKSYDDFGVAMDKLRVKKGVSFDTVSFSTGIAQSYLWGLANRRKANLPKDELMEKIANYFQVKPDYFYEWRLKRMLETVDKNREFLDHCEKEYKKWSRLKGGSGKKESSEPEEDDSPSMSA